MNAKTIFILLAMAAVGGCANQVNKDQARTQEPGAAANEELKVLAAQADIDTLDGAIATMEVDTGRFPTTEEGIAALLKAPPNMKNWSGPYISKMPLDPWGNPYQYRFPGWENKSGFDLYSKGHEKAANNWPTKIGPQSI